ncbi:MAG: TlpA family protein disulfide reductase [Deltaproteobacteria bacterium]|nr:TlpA family protein disulfide reductase [Deltaproteobacteria bacterium]MBF0524242.1 TlpA family protein disulfide reductase [Deltaproteobacteria bacterium]
MRPTKTKKIAGSVLVTLVWIFTGLFLSCAADKQELPPAPEVVLKDLAGKQVGLKDFRSKVVMVNFFATWCGPCRMEIPQLINFHGKYKDKGFEVIGISLDPNPAAVLEPFAKNMKIPYPLFLGTQDTALTFGGFRGIPTTFLITRDGKIFKKYTGVQPDSILEKDIVGLL